MLLFLFALWAGYDYGDEEYVTAAPSYGYGKYENTDDTDDDFPSVSQSVYSNSKSEKNYAKGHIPALLQHKLSELFSIHNIRQILNLPSTIAELGQWQISNLSDHDVYTRKDRAITNAVEILCSSLKIKAPSFCTNNRTLVERIVTGTFHDKKSVALGQLSQLVQATLKEDIRKFNTLKNKISTIEQQGPEQKRRMLENKARVRAEERKLDESINALTKRMHAKTYNKENRSYDEDELADLKEQKALLLVEPERTHHDLEKIIEKRQKMKKQKHVIGAAIEKLKDIAQTLSEKIKEREDSSDLEDAWDEINRYFEKFEKAKQDDMRREGEAARALADEKEKATASEEKEQTQEMNMLKNLEQAVSTPEGTAEAKKTGGLFSEFFKGIGVK